MRILAGDRARVWGAESRSHQCTAARGAPVASLASISDRVSALLLLARAGKGERVYLRNAAAARIRVECEFLVRTGHAAPRVSEACGAIEADWTAGGTINSKLDLFDSRHATAVARRKNVKHNIVCLDKRKKKEAERG